MSNTLNENAENKQPQPQDTGRELYDSLFNITDRLGNSLMNEGQDQELTEQLQHAAQAGLLYDMDWKPVETVSSTALDRSNLFFLRAPGDIRLLEKGGISATPLTVEEFTKEAMPDSRPKLDPPLTLGEQIGNFFLRLVTFGTRGIDRVEEHERAVTEWEKEKLALAGKAGYSVKLETEPKPVKKTDREKQAEAKERGEKIDKLFDGMEKLGYGTRWGILIGGALKSDKYSGLLDKLSEMEPTDQKIVFERAVKEEHTMFGKEMMDDLAQQAEKFREDPEAYRKTYETETGKVIPSLEVRQFASTLKERLVSIADANPNSEPVRQGVGYIRVMINDAAYGKEQDLEALKEFGKLTNQQITDMCRNIMKAVDKRNGKKNFYTFVLKDFVAQVKDAPLQQSAGPAKGGEQKVQAIQEPIK